jgi:PEP-CTERM motif
LTFDNGSAFNDYFDDFTFGTTISFGVSLYGPALSAPDGVSTSGSTFAFSMFSDALGTIPVLTTDTTDGFASTVAVNLDGTTTVTDFSLQTSVVPQTSPVPEPSNLVLVGTGMGCGIVWYLRRRIYA